MENRRYIYHIMLPSAIALVLFMLTIHVIIIPGYRDNLMEKKRSTIRELNIAAVSILQKYHLSVPDSFTLAHAQQKAIDIISNIRYGDMLQEYFWIIDTTPRMIAYPYLPQKAGLYLGEYTDPEGKRYYREIVDLINQSGSGYINYTWQLGEDTLMVMPKLSYVKLFEPWRWIVGTCINIEDVNNKISDIIRQAVWISIIITIVIAILIIYLTTKNIRAEKQRDIALRRHKIATEKYKTLVDASSDSVFMVMDDEIVYVNPSLIKMLGYDADQDNSLDKTLIDSLKEVIINIHEIPNANKKDFGSQQVADCQILNKDNEPMNVMVTRSAFNNQGKKGYIFTIKDLSGQSISERESSAVLINLKTIADAMNIGIFRCTTGRHARFIEVNKKFLTIFGYQPENKPANLYVQEIISTSEDKKDIMKAINNGQLIKDKLLKFYKADGNIVNVMVSIFPVRENPERVMYCDGIVFDAYEHLSGSNRFKEIPPDQHLSANVLLKPVKEYLKIPPTCSLETPVAVAARLMLSHKSDIILIKGENKEPVGMLTHGDISRRIVTKNIEPTTAVSGIMSSPLIWLSDNEMIMDAFSLMIENKVSYVVVKPKDTGEPGYVSLLSLSQLKKETPEFFIHNIKKSASLEETATLMKQLPNLVSNLVNAGTDPTNTGKLISKVSDSITEKIISKIIENHGTPPAPFVFTSLGSDGRREQTLATDQDNAIIYQTDREKDNFQDYFLELGHKICTQLDSVGYPFCVGNVMAMTPEWCMSLTGAKNKVSAWIDTPNPKELLNVGIFFDFRPIVGDFEIANQLQKHIIDKLRDKNAFFYNLVQNIISIKPPLNARGQISYDTFEDEDFIDIKKPIMILTAIIRMWSLKFGISERNTMERLRSLQTGGIVTASTANEFEQGLRFMMQLRIMNQLKNIAEGKKPSNIIFAKTMSEIDRTMLKKIFLAISAHQTLLSHEFRIG